jgi:hypothetical protein
VGASRAQTQEDVPRTPRGESPELDEAVFPGLARGRLRIQLGAGFGSETEAGDSDVSFATPGIRIALQEPIGALASTELFAAFAASEYDVNHARELFASCGACPVPDEFYSASLGAQGGIQLNPNWSLLRADERWALLAELSGSAHWEDGAFERSLGGGGVLALGYEIPKRLRLALGAKIEVSADGGEVSIDPTGAFRFDVTPWLRLRNRGFGLELSLRAARRLDLFLTGHRGGSSFRLRSREGLPSGAEFSDQRWQIGTGFEWGPRRWLRILFEAGAMVDREISIEADDADGSLASRDVDASPYFDLRFELRL